MFKKKTTSEKKTPQEILEELTYQKQRINSLYIRGEYTACVRFMEDNIYGLYHNERWPENFINTLSVHKKCFLSLGKNKPHEEYLADILIKNEIPVIFARLCSSTGENVSWTSEFFLQQTGELKSEGNFDAALDCADICIKIDPANSEARVIKGQILQELGKTNEAVKMYKEALEYKPSNINAVYCMAQAFMDTDILKAIDYIDKAIEYSPFNDKLHSLKAEVFVKAGKIPEAIECLNIAIEVNQSCEEHSYKLAEIYLSQGNTEAAITAFKQLVSVNEQHLPSLKQLAALLENKDPQYALKCTRIIALAEPENLEIGLLNAKLIAICSEKEYAAEEYTRLLELAPKDHRIHAALAYLYSFSDQNQSLQFYDKAISLEKNLAEYYIGKGSVLESMGESQKALALYHTAIDTDNNNDVPFYKIANIICGSDYKTALEYYDKAISIDSGKAEYHAAKAELLLKNNQITQAVECMKIACQQDPANAAWHEFMGEILEEMDNRASSLQHYTEAVNIDSGMHKSYYAIARHLMDTKPYKALSAINKAISSDMANEKYYYIKCKILIRIDEDKYNINQLKLMDYSGETQEAADEIQALIGGDALSLALFYINRAIELAPQSNNYLCLRAQVLMLMKQESKAMKQYEELLNIFPNNHEALYGIGVLLEKKRDYKSALSCYNRAINACDSQSEYYMAKGRVLAKYQEYYAEAVLSYKKSIELDKWNWQALLELGILFENNGDKFSAMQNLRRCLLVYRKCVPASSHMAALLYEYNPQAALNYIESAIKLDSENWKHYAIKGCICDKLGKSQQAMQMFETAESLIDQSGESYYEFASLIAEFLPQQAEKYCMLAIEQQSDNYDCYILLGDIYSLGPDSEMAMDSYKSAIEINQQNYKGYFKAAQLLFDNNDPAALNYAQSAAEHAEKNIGCMHIKAKALAKFTNDLSSAVSIIDSAIKLEPQNIALHETLADLLTKKKSLLRIPIQKAHLNKLQREYAKMIATVCSQTEMELNRQPEEAAV